MTNCPWAFLARNGLSPSDDRPVWTSVTTNSNLPSRTGVFRPASGAGGTATRGAAAPEPESDIRVVVDVFAVPDLSSSPPPDTVAMTKIATTTPTIHGHFFDFFGCG